MNVKEAVQAAKLYIGDLFSEEGLGNLRLEEVEFDDAEGIWNVTLGFSRSRSEPPVGVAAAIGQFLKVDQALKVVRIDDKDHKILSVKNREPHG